MYELRVTLCSACSRTAQKQVWLTARSQHSSAQRPLRLSRWTYKRDENGNIPVKNGIPAIRTEKRSTIFGPGPGPVLLCPVFGPVYVYSVKTKTNGEKRYTVADGTGFIPSVFIFRRKPQTSAGEENLPSQWSTWFFTSNAPPSWRQYRGIPQAPKNGEWNWRPSSLIKIHSRRYLPNFYISLVSPRELMSIQHQSLLSSHSKKTHACLRYHFCSAHIAHACGANFAWCSDSLYNGPVRFAEKKS